MFQIVTGPFHPVLESSLVDEIRELKSADQWTPLAIVVPSELLRRRLQWLLCVEQGLELYDVHFLTFHQLALRLYGDQVHGVSQSNAPVFQLVSELVLRACLREILSRDLPDLHLLSPSKVSLGSCAALWSTIRDLNEAMVDPFSVLQGVDEGLFEREARHTLHALFVLQSEMRKTIQRLQIGSADDLATLAISWVTDSPFLTRLSRVCYYGFYDLTQVQLSFFEAVTLKVPVTVYTPLVDDPAFAFAQQFYDRHLSTGVVIEKSRSSLPSMPERPQTAISQPSIMVMNAIGAEDELTFVCKEIGNLIELHGYQFEEVGVVARTLEPYQSWIGRLFEQHQIPFTTSAVTPIIHEPAIKLLFQLARLTLNQFFARDLLDVLRSPFYHLNRLGVGQDLLQPDLWEEVVLAMGITRGEEQWLRLSAAAENQDGSICAKVAEHLKVPVAVFRKSLQFFNRLVEEIIVDVKSLPTRARIGEHTEAFVQFIRKHLVLPAFDGTGGDRCRFACETSCAEAIRLVFDHLRQFDGLQEMVTWEEWVGILSQIVKENSIPCEREPRSGVHVLDAMSARGLPFRAVFILGLNEKVFPRYVREDAFLRDCHRRVLAETLGYKIDEKLSGYDEERLLFALLQQAAQHRLYLSFQRADEAGRPLVPSPFLRDLSRKSGQSDIDQELSLPRRFSDRLAHPLFRDSLLTREELGVKLILQGVDPSVLLDRSGQESSVFQQGWNALDGIEAIREELGPFDGMLSSSHEHWQHLVSKGVSPTALEVYARCPFQYFSSQLLCVNVMRRRLTDALSPSDVGTLCHAVLRHVYVHLIKAGWPDSGSFSGLPHTLIASSAEIVFAAYEAEYPTGHWVCWQLLKERVTALVTAEVEASRDAFSKNGFRPIAVEVDAKGQIELTGLSFSALKVHGRLDRVDYNDVTKKFRVVDYKFKSSSKIKSKERDLLAAGIRGHYLQPTLYSFMTAFHVRNEEDDGWQSFRPERVEFVYLAPHWETMVVRSVFEHVSWDSSPGQQLQETLTDLLTGIHKGQFYIFPGEYCQNCPASAACRRLHGPTWLRSHRSTFAKQLLALRAKEIARA